MKSLPSGGDILTVDDEGSQNIIYWMQWIDRENFQFVLFNHELRMMSGPHDAYNFYVHPSDELALLLYKAIYCECIEKNNDS